jgi:glycerophosphoryl diester phosphodiesterase
MRTILSWVCNVVSITCLFGSTAFQAHGADPISHTNGKDQSARRPQVVGHRGLLKHGPENTLVNFRACLELKLGIELDVRRCKDGQLVVIHDDTLDRTTNGKGKVADFTLAELKKLDAGSWFDPAFRSERIPMLAEVFTLLAQHPETPVLVAIDLKEADTEADVVQLAKKLRVLDRLVFIGRSIINADVRRQLLNADATARVARLAESAEGMAQAVQAADCNWLYVRHLPGKEEVGRVHAAGKRLFLSGPKVAGLEPETWKQAAELGIDAILTDHPLELAGRLRGEGVAAPDPKIDPVITELDKVCRERTIFMIGPEKGKRLAELVRTKKPKLVVECGTAIGYSGLWIARELKTLGTGKLITIEIDEKRAKEAEANFKRAGVGDIVTVKIGDASKVLREIVGPVDFLFVDCNFENYLPCFVAAEDKLADGALLVADNAGIGASGMADYLKLVRSRYNSSIEWFDMDLPWGKRDAMEITVFRGGKRDR